MPITVGVNVNISTVAAPTVVLLPWIRLVRTMSSSLEVPVPTTPPFEMIPLVLFSVESIAKTSKILAAGTAVPFCVTKLSGTLGGIGPEAEFI